MKALFEPHLLLTGKVMDLELKRQNVVMSNLANIKTPHYKPLDLEWEEELQAALGRDAKGKLTLTSEQHMPSEFNAKTFDTEFSHAFQPHEVKGDDSVDLDKEMSKLAKNQLMYSALSTVLRKNFEGLKQIITDGGK